MKHIRILILIGLLAAATIIVTAAANADSKPEPSSTTIWYKDIVTVYSPNGTNNAFDYTELSEQIPQIAPKDREELLALSEEQINLMTTAELLVTCLDYPLFGDMYAYDTNIDGFAALVERYNGLQALLAREDVGEVLAMFYCAADLNAIMQTDEFGALRFGYLNTMLSSGELLSSMSRETRRELFDKCISDYDTINKCYSEIFNPFQIARIAIRILYIDSPEFKEFAESNSSVMNYINGSGLIEYSEETWEQVKNHIRNFTN